MQRICGILPIVFVCNKMCVLKFKKAPFFENKKNITPFLRTLASLITCENLQFLNEKIYQERKNSKYENGLRKDKFLCILRKIHNLRANFGLIKFDLETKFIYTGWKLNRYSHE